jgi:hypothetical protein
MAKRHSGKQRVVPARRGASTDSRRPTGSERTDISSIQLRASPTGMPHSTADGSVQGNAGRWFSRSAMDGSVHTLLGSRRTGATMVRLLRRIERLEARAPAPIDVEADIQAASAILSEPDIWKRDSKLAQQALVALWDVYGLEALVLATQSVHVAS